MWLFWGKVVDVQEDRVSVKRRGMIAGVAGLVAGAIALRTAEPAAATDGQPLLLGNATQTATATTGIVANPPVNNPAFLVNNTFAGSLDVHQDGIQGYAANQNNTGLFGRNNDLNGVGTWGEAPNGTGVFGDSATGSGVAGQSSSAAGVYGASTTGFGGQFTGGTAQIMLVPNPGATPPAGTHAVGEIFVAADGTLFYCTVGGATPTFRVAVGPTTAGAFHFLSSPDRYVDTRSNIGGVNGAQPRTRRRHSR